MENDAGGDAQIVLILRACAQFVEMRHEVIHLHRTNCETVRDFEVHATADRHGKRIIRSGKRQSVIACNVRDAKKHLAERSDPRIVAIGNAWAEMIRRECPVNSSAKNIIRVIAGKVCDCAEPVIGVGDARRAAKVARTRESTNLFFPKIYMGSTWNFFRVAALRNSARSVRVRHHADGRLHASRSNQTLEFSLREAAKA